MRRHNGIERVFEGYGFIWVDSINEVREILAKQPKLLETRKKYLRIRLERREEIEERFSINTFQTKINRIVSIS